MAPVSTVPGVKAALVALIGAEAPDVQVDYADQGDTAGRQRVWMGNVQTHNSAPAGMRPGKRRREEEYDLSVWVEVVGLANAMACEARAFELAAIVEEVVSTDPQLGGVANLLFVRMDGLDSSTTEVAGEGPRCEIEVSLFAKGNLL